MIKWASVRYLVERSERERRAERMKEQAQIELKRHADLQRVLDFFRADGKA